MLAILAAVMLAAAPQNDTVYTANGGRLVGTVVEETPQAVTIQLPDGTTRRLSRAQVTRIEYADGSVSSPSRPPPPAQPPTYRTPPPQPSYPAQPPAYRPPPPAYGPPPYGPPAYPPQRAHRGMPQLMPFWASFGIGGSFPTGRAEGGTAASPDVPIDQRFGSQLGIWLEGGARVTPHLGLGLYLDLGMGDPAGEASAACNQVGTSCTASTGRVGVLLRHTFDPYAASTPWIAIGTGYEWADISYDDPYYGSTSFLNYHGWEMLRLMAGVDLRTSPVFGVGLYGGASLGSYSHADYHDGAGDLPVASQTTHWTVEAGLRFTLFP